MKKLILSFVSLLLPMIASADAVLINGIYYNLSTSAPWTAEVTHHPTSFGFYSGLVDIPSSVSYENQNYNVTSIGWQAFQNCSGLTGINIPNSVTTIDVSAFYGCSGLENVSIPNSVTTIGGAAFYGCSGLTGITIPNSVTTIGGGAFIFCTCLTSIHIPSSVTSIGEDYSDQTIVSDCPSISSITVDPENTVYDSRNACNAIIKKSTSALIQGCKNTIIPSGITKISDNAFAGCSGLTSISIPNTVTDIGEYAFSNSGLTSISIPASVNYIITGFTSSIFHNCENLTSIVVDPENTVYDSRDGCNAIILKNTNQLVAGCKGTVIPNSVTAIASYAFSWLTTLTTITIPSSVTTVSFSAFWKCTSLSDVYCKATSVPSGGNPFRDCDLTGATLHVPSESVSAYSAATYWKDFNAIVGITKDFSSSDITISSIDPVTYNGSAQTPAVIVKDGNTTLTEGTDYTVAYSDNTNAGTATVTITGIGDYTGTKTANFTINAKSASNMAIFSIAAVTYNGATQNPSIIVMDGSTTLIGGTDYTIAYSDNINAGTATVTVTGKGNYTGTKTANFTINAKDVSNLTISDIAAVTYNGMAQTPAVTVKDKKLDSSYTSDGIIKVFSNYNNIDISIKYLAYEQNTCNTTMCCIVVRSPSGEEMILDSRDLFNNNEIGAYCVSNDGYTFIDLQAKEAGTWHLLLVQRNAGNWYYSLSNSMQTCIDYTLQNGTDYTVAYSDNTNVGTATVTITGKGNYTGTKTVNFTISPSIKDVSSLTISEIAVVTYNGSAQTPAVTVMDGTTTLACGTDYTVSYSNNVNAGTATATITGSGNYTGTTTANFTINKAPLTITANSYTINQGDALPAFAVSYSGFQNGETSSVLTTQPTITCDAADSETTGIFDITPSGAVADNYSMTYVKGTLTIETTSVNITVNSLGIGTYCSEYPLDFTNVSGIDANIISGFKPSTGKLILTRAYEVPAGTGLYIVGTPGNTYNVPVKETDFYYSNLMKGVLTNSTIPTYEGSYTNYVLVPYGSNGVVFARANDASLSANRAYVQIPTSIVGAREYLDIEIDDGSTTGLDGVFTPDTKEAEGDYYNLSGQKVQTPQKGLYIKNGKKIFIH